jgi:hypothetical protein
MIDFPRQQRPAASGWDGGGGPPRDDRLRRVVHVLLLLYLLPAILTVLLVGSVLALLEAVVDGSIPALLGRPGRGLRARIVAAGGDGRPCDLRPARDQHRPPGSSGQNRMRARDQRGD